MQQLWNPACHWQLRIWFKIVGGKHIHTHKVSTKAIISVGFIAGDGTAPIISRCIPTEGDRSTRLATGDLGQDHQVGHIGGGVEGHPTPLPREGAFGIVHAETLTIIGMKRSARAGGTVRMGLDLDLIIQAANQVGHGKFGPGHIANQDLGAQQAIHGTIIVIDGIAHDGRASIRRWWIQP